MDRSAIEQIQTTAIAATLIGDARETDTPHIS